MKIVLTPNQRELFERIKEFVLAHKPGKSEALHFPPDLNTVDRRFIEVIAKDLGLQSSIEYSNEDNSKHIYVEFDDDSDEDYTENDIDEEDIEARNRVLKKYEDAPTVAELSQEEIEKKEKEKAEIAFKQWKTDYYMVKIIKNIEIRNIYIYI